MTVQNLNLAQSRIIDPILTTVVQGYKLPGNIGMGLFPRVPVQTSGGQILEFGKEAFKLYNTRRAPGTAYKRITFGYLGKPFALENHGIEVLVPREQLRDASLVPGIDVASRAINLNMRVSELQLEYQQASIARNAANYASTNKVTLSGTSQWSDYTNSDPVSDVNDAKEAIRQQTGVYPNVFEISATVFRQLKEHPKLLDKIKYTQKGVLTADLLASVFEVDKVLIGSAIATDDTDASTDLWGKDAILAYVPPEPSTNEEPSFGYTYAMEGNPLVEVPYWENATKSWVYGVGYERVAVLSGIDSGFLIQNAVA